MPTQKNRLTTSNVLAGVAHWFGHPGALVGLLGFTLAWFLFEKYVMGWDGWITVFAMALALVNQNSQNRDTAALHAKLDCIIDALPEASNDLKKAEKLTEGEIEKLRPD